jgi:ubiquinone/menaquinone biosynthesis C-methylase UbiE
MLSHTEAKQFYDRLGARQDKGSYFEAPALAILRQQAAFATAQRLFEFGCGTGSFAAAILADELPTAATYLGLDQSTTMVQLAAARIAPFGARATVALSGGAMTLPAATGAVDRFVCNYVLDLLPATDIGQLLTEAHRTLRPGGLLCLTSLTHGTTPRSRLAMAGWQAIYLINPQRFGGCRPIAVTPYLDEARWALCHRAISITRGLASEVVIARRRP